MQWTSGRKAASSLHQTSHYPAVDICLVNGEQSRPSSFGPANCLEARVLHCRGAAALFQPVVRNSTHSTGGYYSNFQQSLAALQGTDWKFVTAALCRQAVDWAASARLADGTVTRVTSVSLKLSHAITPASLVLAGKLNITHSCATWPSFSATLI